jgi:hypothetical protein
VDTDLRGADLSSSHIYGVSAWGLKLEKAKQQNLVITRLHEPEITVDNIEVAQFIYLMLRNEKIRDVIDTITSKAVLPWSFHQKAKGRPRRPSRGTAQA